MEVNQILGVDYGSKEKGTIAYAYLAQNKIFVHQVQKGVNGDSELEKTILKHSFQLIAIDAPLSLPIVYSNKLLGSDYHFRVADRETNAMSPMFIGGLTANAIALKDRLADCHFIETYPSKLLRYLDIKKPDDNYSEWMQMVLKKLTMDVKLPKNIDSKHQFDAVLCLISGIRYSKNEALNFGNSHEGLIYI